MGKSSQGDGYACLMMGKGQCYRRDPGRLLTTSLLVGSRVEAVGCQLVMGMSQGHHYSKQVLIGPQLLPFMHVAANGRIWFWPGQSLCT